MTVDDALLHGQHWFASFCSNGMHLLSRDPECQTCASGHWVLYDEPNAKAARKMTAYRRMFRPGLTRRP